MKDRDAWSPCSIKRSSDKIIYIIISGSEKPVFALCREAFKCNCSGFKTSERKGLQYKLESPPSFDDSDYSNSLKSYNNHE